MHLIYLMDTNMSAEDSRFDSEIDETDEQNENKTKPGRCSFYKPVTFTVYCAHAITTWGDRMWAFAVGVFLVKLTPGSLLLTALYGVVSCIAMILFSAPVGNWVDRVPRLLAARRSLIIQNSFVIASALVLCLELSDAKKHFSVTDETWSYVSLAVQIGVIVLATAARVSSVAYDISLTKDWVVVIAAGDKARLARINAMNRRIDLTTKILSPLMVGQIMTLVSDLVAAIVIAVWNVISMMVEYLLIYQIYCKVPALALKKGKKQCEEKSAELEDLMDKSGEQRTNLQNASVTENKTNCCQNIFDKIIAYKAMWGTYFEQSVMPAGLGLAFLYMTVLGFDNITTGYAYNQGVSELVLGVLSGLGGTVGILGTLAYPVLLKKIGLIRTGLFGFAAEVTCLSLCVISIWVSGSPFDPSYTFTWGSTKSVNSNSYNITEINLNTFENASFVNLTISPVDSSISHHNNSEGKNYTSVILLMSGILLARFGLWMADLTVNQLLQAEVAEEERGVVNGVQHALNTLMDLFKFGLVILLPNSETFGILIIISFLMICLGWISYAVYARRIRGHILPLHGVFKKLKCNDLNVNPGAFENSKKSGDVE